MSGPNVRWTCLVAVAVTFSACGLIPRESAVQRTVEDSGAKLGAAIDDYLALSSANPPDGGGFRPLL